VPKKDRNERGLHNRHACIGKGRETDGMANRRRPVQKGRGGGKTLGTLIGWNAGNEWNLRIRLGGRTALEAWVLCGGTIKAPKPSSCSNGNRVRGGKRKGTITKKKIRCSKSAYPKDGAPFVKGQSLGEKAYLGYRGGGKAGHQKGEGAVLSFGDVGEGRDRKGGGVLKRRGL